MDYIWTLYGLYKNRNLYGLLYGLLIRTLYGLYMVLRYGLYTDNYMDGNIWTLYGLYTDLTTDFIWTADRYGLPITGLYMDVR